MIVVDCSALLAFMLQPESHAHYGRVIGEAEALAAPDILDVELISALRRLERQRKISGAVATRIAEDLMVLPLNRFPSHEFILDIWNLRHNFSAHDASYVALAKIFKAPLLTADNRLRHAATEFSKIELI